MNPFFKQLFSRNSYLLKAIAAGYVMILAWDILWCAQTTFRAMSFTGTYLNSLIMAMIMALPSLFTRRVWVQTATWTIFAIWLVANLMYCRTYLSIIPLVSYLLAGNLTDFTASVVDSLRLIDLTVFIIIIAGTIWLRKSRREKPSRKFFAVTFLSLIAVSAINGAYNGGLVAHVEHLSQECYYASTPPVIYTPAGTLIGEALADDDNLTPESEAKLAAWMKEQQRRLDAYPETPRTHRSNLVVIFCESLESWLINAKADGDKPITPYLNRLAADSTTLFAPHVRSQVGSGRSIDAQLLMLAGMYPPPRFVWSMKYPFYRYHSIAEAMKNANPATKSYLLTPDKPITWNQSHAAKALSIDTLLSRDSWRETEMIGKPAKLSDGAFLSQSVDKLRSGQIWPAGQQAFTMLITYSGHNPFKLPDNLKQIDITGDYPAKMTDYMTMANYTDRSLATIVEYLRSRPDWPETMVMIVGDHEALGTYRKEWLANPTAAKILSAESEVPLLILNSPVAGRFDKVIGEVDVYNTVIDLMNLRAHAWPGMGESLLNPAKVDITTPDAHIKSAPEMSRAIILSNPL